MEDSLEISFTRVSKRLLDASVKLLVELVVKRRIYKYNVITCDEGFREREKGDYYRPSVL